MSIRSQLAPVRTLILGTAGHVDHGKTTLIRALTGTDTDRLPEEKQRGMTIDIGFARLDLGDVLLGVVDVPGHERFVKNMLAGTTTIDAALLVVAADDGVMPQTREHLAILDLLGVSCGVVAVTKCDTRPSEWIDLVLEEVRDLVRDSCLENAPMVLTALSGNEIFRGQDELKAALGRVCAGIAPRSAGPFFRLPIDRSFTIAGRGTVVTGSVWSGAASVEDKLEWLPVQSLVSIRGLENHNQSVMSVERGQRAAINLAGVHHKEIHRGHELATPGYLKPSQLLTVELYLLPSSPCSLKDRSRQRMYLATQEVMVRISLLDRRQLEPGERALAQLTCQEPTMSISCQPFVMREETLLRTIGGGRVLQPVARRLKRPASSLLARLRSLASKDINERTDAAVYFFGTEQWTLYDLCRDANLIPVEAEEALSALCASHRVIEILADSRSKRLIHTDSVGELQARVLAAIETIHKAFPLRPAVSRRQLCERFSDAGNLGLMEAIIDRMLSICMLEGDRKSVRRSGFRPRLAPRQVLLLARIVQEFERLGAGPPGFDDLAASMGTSRSEVESLVQCAIAEQRLIHIADEIYLATAAEVELRLKLRDAIRRDGPLTVSRIKELLGTTRKFAIPICEYLDEIGFTCKDGDLRRLG